VTGTPPLHELKRLVVDVCRKIDAREYVGGRDGNVSARVGARNVLVTPAGVRKGDVTVDDLLLVDRSGRVVQGRGSASTETGMHLRIYDLRPDVGGVVHAHPPVATGFAAAGLEISECVLPEVIVGLGSVPLARYATPGTDQLSASLDPLLEAHDAWLLENHGVVTAGPDLGAAHHRMETVEQAARILLVARLLGGPRALEEGEVRALLESRGRYGVREGLAACDVVPGAGVPRRTSAPGSGDSPGAENADEELVRRVTERILSELRRR
jgi:L-fuculose-phosphate aldolase